MLSDNGDSITGKTARQRRSCGTKSDFPRDAFPQDTTCDVRPCPWSWRGPALLCDTNIATLYRQNWNLALEESRKGYEESIRLLFSRSPVRSREKSKALLMILK